MLKLYYSIFVSLLISTSWSAPRSLVLDHIERDNCEQVHSFFHFCGNEKQLQRVIRSLEEIKKTSIGRNTIAAIESSGHRLLIKHSTFVTSMGGRSLSLLVDSLSNGEGTEVVIEMNLDAPSTGTHRVRNHRHELVEFTFVQNLFNNLSDACYRMSGTWLVFGSEKKAIDDENIFRAQEGQIHSKPYAQRNYRARGDEVQVWFAK